MEKPNAGWVNTLCSTCTQHAEVMQIFLLPATICSSHFHSVCYLLRCDNKAQCKLEEQHLIFSLDTLQPTGIDLPNLDSSLFISRLPIFTCHTNFYICIVEPAGHVPVGQKVQLQVIEDDITILEIHYSDKETSAS